MHCLCCVVWNFLFFWGTFELLLKVGVGEGGKWWEGEGGGDCASSEEEGHLLVTNLWSGWELSTISSSLD